MKIDVKTSKLLDSLKFVSQIVDPNNPYAIDRYVYIRTIEKDQLLIRAVNRHITTEAIIRPENMDLIIHRPGDVLVPFKNLIEILQVLDEETVTFQKYFHEIELHTISTKAERTFSLPLPALSTQNPYVPVPDNGTYFDLDLLKKLLKKGGFATSKNPKELLTYKYVQIQMENNNLKVSSADRSHAAYSTSSCTFNRPFSIAVPDYTAKLIESLPEKEAFIGTDGYSITLITSTKKIRIQQIREKLPPVDKYMSKPWDLLLKLDAHKVNEILNQLQVLSSNIIQTITITIQNQTIRFMIDDEIYGKASRELTLENSFLFFEVIAPLESLKNCMKIFNGNVFWKLSGQFLILESEDQQTRSLLALAHKT